MDRASAQYSLGGEAKYRLDETGRPQLPEKGTKVHNEESQQSFSSDE